MKRIDKILQNEKYREHIEKIEMAEVHRNFCRHNMGHFLDVARIAMILNLQEDFGLPEEWIYAAALLHDIGRWVQYETGEDHAKVSEKLAPEILTECGFTEEESRSVTKAIGNHRNREIAGDKNLDGLLYRADKLSRPCYACKMEKACDWKQDKKNLRLKI